MRTLSEGLLKTSFQRTSMTGYLCSHDSIDCGRSIHNGYVKSAARCTYTLSSGVSSGRRRVRRTTSVRFEMALQSFLREKFSPTMVIRAPCTHVG